MRKPIFVSSLFVLSILFSGCIFVSSNKTQAAPPKPSDTSSCVESPQVRATLAEINAAAKLTSQSARANIYKAIAKRPGLSPQERIHLTKAVTTHLNSQSAKEEVLQALVNNHPPAVQPASRQKLAAKPQIPCMAEPKKDSASTEPVAEK